MDFYQPCSIELSRFIDHDAILAAADDALGCMSLHITDVVAPLSEGGLHDFYSNGDYWWPDPDTADGLPYVRRDGESNPHAFTHHRRVLREMRTRVAALTAAYLLSRDERYAEKAVSMLKAFFLDDMTRMNPHLEYAQAIPGVCSGRGIGLIDSLHLIDVPVAIDQLQSSKAMTPVIYQGLQTWFADYLTWMTTHPYGIDEMNEANNHGVCWHVQAAVFANFTQDQQVLALCRDHYKNKILPAQMATDGSFPLELARTKPYAYSIFVLDNMVTLCYTLSTEQDNLWAFSTPDGKTIHQGLAFLYPYLQDKNTWPYMQDIEHFEGWPVAMSFMLFAFAGLGDDRFPALWKQHQHKVPNDEIRRNTAIRQPALWLQNQ